MLGKFFTPRLFFLSLPFMLISTYMIQSLYLTKLAALLLTIFCASYFFAQHVLTKISYTLIALSSLFIVSALSIQGWHTTIAALLLLLATYAAYHSIKTVIPDAITAIFILLMLVIGASFTPAYYAPFVTMGLVFLFLLLIVTKQTLFIKNIYTDYESLKHLTFIDVFCWSLLFMTVVVLGFICKQGLIAADPFHPIYELSIGQSYTTLFNTPDLSYSNKILRFHFLATRIPLYFSSLFHVPILNALYFLTPLFFLFISFILVGTFFKRYSVAYTPICVLFFLPFLNVVEYFGSLFRTTLVLAPSFFLSFLLMIIAIHYLISEHLLLLLTAAALLLVTKASFFFTLSGGIFLYYLRYKKFKQLSLLLPALSLIFFLLYFLFLSNAHPQMLWVSAPFFATYYFLKKNVFAITFILVLFCCAIYTYRKNSNKILCALSSVGLSGIIGFILLTDVIEGNHAQFYIAAYFSLAIVLWHVLIKFLQNKHIVVQQAFSCAFCILLLNSVVFCLNRPFIRFTQWLRPHTRISHAPTNLIKAYSWLRHSIPDNSIVLYGKHYEHPYSHNLLTSQMGHIRSALSGKQMYCESNHWKGLMMEKDFGSRFLDTMNFYQTFVIASPHSRIILKNFFQVMHKKVSPALPLSLATDSLCGISLPMLNKLSFGKEWCMHNRMQQIKHEISTKIQMRTQPFNEDDACNFLKRACITHILLEQDDKPSVFLNTITKKIYDKSGIIILHVHNNNITRVNNSVKDNTYKKRK